MTPEFFRVAFTASAQLQAKLKKAQKVLAHQFPDGDLASILEAGLDLLLEKAEKRRGIVDSPRPPKQDAEAKPPTRHIAHSVSRELFARDEGRCQWPLANGGICGNERFIQIDHVHPFALGGQGTLESTRLLCAFHNRLYAEQVYGKETIDRVKRRRRAKQGETVNRDTMQAAQTEAAAQRVEASMPDGKLADARARAAPGRGVPGGTSNSASDEPADLRERMVPHRDQHTPGGSTTAASARQTGLFQTDA
jgi:hypothetical protein